MERQTKDYKVILTCYLKGSFNDTAQQIKGATNHWEKVNQIEKW